MLIKDLVFTPNSQKIHELFFVLQKESLLFQSFFNDFAKTLPKKYTLKHFFYFIEVVYHAESNLI